MKGNLNEKRFFTKIQLNDLPGIRALLKKDIRLLKTTDKQNLTALQFAVTTSQLPTIKLLIEEFNADPKAAGPRGRNSFLWGVGRVDVLRYLDSIESSLKHSKDNNGFGALSIAVLWLLKK